MKKQRQRARRKVTPLVRLELCRKVNNATRLIEDRLLALSKRLAPDSPEWLVTAESFRALYRLARIAKKKPNGELTGTEARNGVLLLHTGDQPSVDAQLLDDLYKKYLRESDGEVT